MKAVDPPLLLIVSGPPASGKTTLGRRLASDLNLPFFNKDGFKERLFDRLGCDDRERSRQFGLASYDLLYYAIEVCLTAGQSVAAESNLSGQIAAAEILQLRQSYTFEPVQVMCWAPERVLRDRFRQRDADGERHPGHVDRRVSDEDLASILQGGRYEPLGIGGEVIWVEMTHPEAVDYARILAQVQAMPALQPKSR